MQNDSRSAGDSPVSIVAATTPSSVPEKGGEPTLMVLQRQDPSLTVIIQYLEKQTLPVDEKKARELVLSESQYTLLDGILYHVESDKTLRIIPPQSRREELFQEAHGGMFGGHLRDAKIHGQLSKHYWWPGMRADILKWCRACLPCASRRVGRAVRPPLTPIPVAGPFDRVGVDVIQFPKSYEGNQYAVVFVDYLTKWPEVFAVPDQTALMIAQLLVKQIISRHGVPAEILSDRGGAFLSGLMQEVYQLMGIHKMFTTAYHPQTDGLVERFNRTLTDMLAKTVQKNGRDWDQHLPQVLFAYRTSLQESTKESPFFLLYGRDDQLPTEATVSQPRTRYQVDLDDYKTHLTSSLTEAWELARSHVQKAQKQQKRYYDRHAREPTFQVGDRVFIYMPSPKTGKSHKFARPFHGPYRILELTANDAKVCLIDQSRTAPIFVVLDRIRHCPDEISPGQSWPCNPQRRITTTAQSKPEADPSDAQQAPPTQLLTFEDATTDSVFPPKIWEGRLRSNVRDASRVRTPGDKGGDM